MSAEVLKNIQSVEDEIKRYTLEKIKIEQILNTLKEKKSDLKTLYNKRLSEEQAGWETWVENPFPWHNKIGQILEKTFGLKEFRKQQLAAVNATLSKKDTLLIMPTGGGKSLCYQLPTMLEDGMTVVVSPLIALMEDQIHKLQKLNILVYKITASESTETKKTVFDYLHKGIGTPIKLLYISPEMLVKSKKLVGGLQACHKVGNLNRIAIDEVHCCSEWGHDFRPDYRYLGLLKDLFKDVPIIGLTATATTFILNDVREILNIPACTIIRAPFDRPNLLYKVIPKPPKLIDSLQLINKIILLEFKNASGIIYANSIKECEDITKGLRELGLKVQLYHAQLDNEHRFKIYDRWMKNIYHIVVATIAFGLGIDKPDVRFVIHSSVPKTIEDLYQQSGRAGRDGNPATCIVLYRLGDYLKHTGYAKSRKEMQRVGGVLNYVLNLKDCRHDLIGSHFEEETNLKCRNMCDNCLRQEQIELFSLTRACKEIYNVIDAAQKKDLEFTLIKLIDSWTKTYKITITKEHAENIIGYLLQRGYLSEKKSYTSYTVISYLKKSYEIPPEHSIHTHMIRNSALRTYLGPVPVVSPERKISPLKGSKKRKTSEEFCQPSTSKVKVGKLTN